MFYLAIGRLCEKCDGKCVICDSYVRPCTLVRICDECNYGSYQGRCVICGGPGVSDAYYCKECTIQEKDVSVQKNVTILLLSSIHVSFVIYREMDVPRLLTWEVPKQTCFMKGKSMDLRRDNLHFGFHHFFLFVNLIAKAFEQYTPILVQKCPHLQFTGSIKFFSGYITFFSLKR